MVYSLIEQVTLDLDIFFADSSKGIHLASGGGILPNELLATDVVNETVKTLFETQIFEFLEVEVNPNLRQLLNLDEIGYENYISDFLYYAKRGLYSYDKTNLDDKEDLTFHLVARPKFMHKFYPLFFLQLFTDEVFDKFVLMRSELPIEFEKFNLSEYFN